MNKLVPVGLCVLLAACASRPVASPAPLLLPSGEPASLIGLSAGELRGVFGKPVFVRKENGSEMWRYDGANCRAFFFLYPNGTAQAVRHVETIPRGPASAADFNCLTALRVRPPAS